MADPSPLPPSIEAAWGREPAARRGPRPGLTLDRVVEAGVALAAREGLGAVSMGRVARELGASTMGLYRYVGSKDELLVLMVDRAVRQGAEQPTRPPNGSWRAGLEHVAHVYWQALRRHPWIVRVPITAPPVTPNQLEWLEAGLWALRETGLSEAEKLSVMLLVSGYVRSQATLTADLESAAPEVMPGYGATVARLADPERFPALLAAIGSGALDDDDYDPEAEFAFGLARILDGVERLVASRA
jgi:AcrR family transcriptional regulator